MREQLSLQPPDGMLRRLRRAWAAASRAATTGHADTVAAARPDGFTIVADACADLIARHDREGRLAYVNPALQRLLDLPAADGCFVEDVAQYRDLLAQALVTGLPQQARLRYRRLDRRPGWLDARVCAERSSTGQVLSLLTIARDVTEADEPAPGVEEEIRRRIAPLEAALEEARLLSKAKSDFVATMSHEIRNPLGGVIGLADMLAQTRLDEHQRRLVEAAQSTGRHLLGLLDRLLDIARLEDEKLQLEPSEVDLARLGREVLDGFVGLAARRQLMLCIDVAPDVPRSVRLDPLRMRQVLVNLLDNAIKFTREGSVTLRIARLERGTAGADGRACLHFEVQDTGIGIRPDDVERLFERYARSDDPDARARPGIGLGLSICAGIVRLMGGRLQVDSREGRGSRFHFEIQVEPVEPQQSTSTSASTSTPD